MDEQSLNKVATIFVLRAIQDWGQTEEQGTAAVQAVLDAAGFKATATCRPVFGGIWPKPCEGPEAETASAWLQTLTGTMQRGKFESERDHVVECICARQAERAA